MCMVHGVQYVITNSAVNSWVQRFKVGRVSTSDEPRRVVEKKDPAWYAAGINKLE